VTHTGTWTTHETTTASGGAYVYSSGSAEDVLSLAFAGTQLEIIYVKHPALGVFVVEVDGVPLQLVDSVAQDSEFGTKVTFTLAEGPHSLRCIR